MLFYGMETIFVFLFHVFESNFSIPGCRISTQTAHPNVATKLILRLYSPCRVERQGRRHSPVDIAHRLKPQKRWIICLPGQSARYPLLKTLQPIIQRSFKHQGTGGYWAN